MTSAEEQLTTLGFGRGRRETPCWRAVRADPPVCRARHDDAPDPADSRALALWRQVLARDPRPSPYRIRRVAK
jgi:hypothetical protein